MAISRQWTTGRALPAAKLENVFRNAAKGRESSATGRSIMRIEFAQTGLQEECNAVTAICSWGPWLQSMGSVHHYRASHCFTRPSIVVSEAGADRRHFQQTSQPCGLQTSSNCIRKGRLSSFCSHQTVRSFRHNACVTRKRGGSVGVGQTRAVMAYSELGQTQLAVSKICLGDSPTYFLGSVLLLAVH